MMRLRLPGGLSLSAPSAYDVVAILLALSCFVEVVVAGRL